MEEFAISDYLNVLRRRIKLFAIVAGAVFAFSVVFAFSWSNYRSEATVEVAQPEISEAVTASSGGIVAAMQNLADLHISRIQQKVLSTGSLAEIITKFNLYPKMRQSTPMADLTAKMRKKVKVKLLSSTLANPASAMKVSADQLSAIAFSLSFDYDDPGTAQLVTNELVSRFMDEDAKDRRGKAKETSAFLDAQLKTLEESLAEQEKNIAEFRSANGDVRPEALGFNQQAMASAQMSLQNLESQISTNIGAQGALRAQLAATDPYSRLIGEGRLLTTPTAQLKSLKSDYASLSAKYGPAHPDVLKLKRQIASLETAVGPVNASAALEAQIDDTKTKLATIQKQYGAANPEVVGLQKQLKGLQAQLDKERANPPGDTLGLVADADNPTYLQIVAQLRATMDQGRALSTQRDEIRRQLDKFQRAVIQNPQVEQKLAALTRDYDNAQMRYKEMKAKKMAASMTETIELERSGQRLLLINPPEVPLRTQPARLLFLLAGFFAAIMAGLGSVLGAQYLSQSVIGTRHLESLVGVAPLVAVPHIGTLAEKNKRKQLKLRTAAMAAGGFVLFLIVFSYVVMPLDVLWAIIVRRLGLY